MDPDIWLLIPVKTSQLFFSFLLNCPIKYSTALMAESDFAWAQHSISDISGCSWICSYFPFHCRPLCPLLGLEFIDFPIRQFSEFLEIFMGAHHHVDVISSKGFLRFICQSLSMALSRDHGKFGMLKGWGLMHEEVCVPLRGWHMLKRDYCMLLQARQVPLHCASLRPVFIASRDSVILIMTALVACWAQSVDAPSTVRPL